MNRGSFLFILDLIYFFQIHEKGLFLMKRFFVPAFLFLFLFSSSAFADDYFTHSTGHFNFQVDSQWVPLVKNDQLHVSSPQGFEGGYIIAEENKCILDGYDLDDYYHDIFVQADQDEKTHNITIEYLTVAGAKSILLSYDILISNSPLRVYCIVSYHDDYLLTLSYHNSSVSNDEAYQHLLHYADTISFVSSPSSSNEKNAVEINFDLSGMSYDELVALRDQINLAMWNSAEWQAVTVPQGIWKVGVDIPEGHWTIKPVEGVYAYVTYGSTLEENGKEVSYKSKDYYSESIFSPTSSVYDHGEDMFQIDIDAKSGSYIEVERGDVVFMPYSGKQKLGFK